MTKFDPFQAAAAIHAKMRAAGAELVSPDAGLLDLSGCTRVERMCPDEPRNAYGFPVHASPFPGIRTPGLPDETDPPPAPPVPGRPTYGSTSGPGQSPAASLPAPLEDVLILCADSDEPDAGLGTWDIGFRRACGTWHSATFGGDEIPAPLLWWSLPAGGPR